MSRWRSPLLILLVMVIATSIALANHNRLVERKDGAPEHEVAPAARMAVTVHKAGTRTIGRKLELTGTVAVREPVDVGAVAGGLRVESVLVDEGDFVEKGAVLAELDSAMIREQIAQQEARLRASEANAARAANPVREQDTSAAQATLSQAQAQIAQEEANLVQARSALSFAQTSYDRYQGLFNEGATTRQEVENKQADLERSRSLVRAAEERVRAAQFAAEGARQRLDLSQAGGRVEDVIVAESNADEIRTVIRQLEIQLAQTAVRAPMSGLVLKRSTHLGDITTPGAAMFQMAGQGQLELWADVPQDDLPSMAPGTPVSVSVGAKKLQGKVRGVAPSMDVRSRLATVRIALPADARLLPGMFLRGELAGAKRQALVVAPSTVLGPAEAPYVMVVRDGHARKQPVKVGSRGADYVEIASGLAAGDPVVLSGAALLSDGDTVTVR